MTGKHGTPKERFWLKVNKDGPLWNGTPCWLWTAGLGGEGYGSFYAPPKDKVLAHRFAFEQIRGSIPEGLTLDHLCRIRCCVNPDHLEAVTRRENILRGVGMGALNAQKTLCHRGHELILVARNTQRRCKTCKNKGERESRTRKRAANTLAETK